MNTPNLIEQMIKDGKMKFGNCDRCNNKEHLFRVKMHYFCSDCLDKLFIIGGRGK